MYLVYDIKRTGDSILFYFYDWRLHLQLDPNSVLSDSNIDFS